MATIRKNTRERVYSITRWLGVNEAGAGLGEGAVCRNFRVTPGGALVKRGGSHTVAELKARYSCTVSDEAEVMRSEIGETSLSFPAYSLIESVDGETVRYYGDGKTVTFGNAAEAAGYYADVGSGSCAEFAGVERVVGDKLADAETGNHQYDKYDALLVFDDEPEYKDGRWDLSVGRIITLSDRYLEIVGKWGICMEGYNWPEAKDYRFVESVEDFRDVCGTQDPRTFLFVESDVDYEIYNDPQADWNAGCIGYKGETHAPVHYDWSFRAVTITEDGEPEDTAVRGIWSGYVGGRELLCAAAAGHLWRLSVRAQKEEDPSSTASGPPSPQGEGYEVGDGTSDDEGEGFIWEKEDIGKLDTSGAVSMVGFGNRLYAVNGRGLYVWDGRRLSPAEGYRPLILTGCTVNGSGTKREAANLLTGARRVRYSPNGETAVFRLPEAAVSVDYVRRVRTGEDIPGAVFSPSEGCVRFPETPNAGENTVEIGYTAESAGLPAVRFAERFGDTLFLCGDGTNRVFASADGRADWFPEDRVVAVGDENTPVTALLAHHSRLLAFKEDSAWSISAGSGLRCVQVSREVGCVAPGEARLCENRPRTLDGRSVMEWRTIGASSNITSDQRSAEPVSRRVDAALRSIDLARAHAFYDKINREYYVLGGDTAIVQSLDADAWYVYTGFPAVCMINYRDEVYYGTGSGEIRHFSDAYGDDCGEPVQAVWESGPMDFGEAWREKRCASVYLSIVPEEGAALTVTAVTDRRPVFHDYSVRLRKRSALPENDRLRLTARRFRFMKLVLTTEGRAKVVGADVKIRN